MSRPHLDAKSCRAPPFTLLHVNAQGLPRVVVTGPAIAGPAQETRSQTRDSFSELVMTTTKNLLIAALLSSVAFASFAQTPAAPKPATPTTSKSAAAAPADAASPVKKHHHKHRAKKAAAAATAASTGK